GGKQQRIAIRIFAAGVVDDGLETGNAPKALAGSVGLGVAIGIGAGDRVETGVEVVDMQDVQRELGMGGGRKTGAKCERGRAQKQFLHPCCPFFAFAIDVNSPEQPTAWGRPAASSNS